MRVRRRAVIVLAAVAALAVGTITAAQAIRRQVDRAIPQADLFGPTLMPSPTFPPSPSAQPSPSPSPLPGADIRGPLNILIVGIDSREWIPSWMPHADTVMIMHVDADLSHATLVSLPRDLILNIPAFPPARFGGQRTKLTHAMSEGATVPGSSRPDPAQGFQLVAKTVSNYTGISRFDAGALLTFTGLRKVVDALGGVDLYVDQRVQSIHLQPGGAGRLPCRSCANGYTGPRATYDVGVRHLNGWQALDYVRQRYISGADYARTRHQRQLVEAIIGRALQRDVLANPATVADLVRALGSTLVFDGRGRTPTDFAYALRKLRPAAISEVSLPGSGVYSRSGQYLGESLDGVQSTYFAALRQDKLDAWTRSHSSLVG
jgi:polyisoprenyl-teichoic acid--peptidoglycan teichoic acid transferase